MQEINGETYDIENDDYAISIYYHDCVITHEWIKEDRWWFLVSTTELKE